jgi:hypothetical protein
LVRGGLMPPPERPRPTLRVIDGDATREDEQN